MPATHARLATALIFVTPALWCVNYLIARRAPGTVEPYTLAFGRWLVAALILSVFTAGELRRHAPTILREWKRFLVLGTYFAAQAGIALSVVLFPPPPSQAGPAED